MRPGAAGVRPSHSCEPSSAALGLFASKISTCSSGLVRGRDRVRVSVGVGVSVRIRVRVRVGVGVGVRVRCTRAR